MARDAENSVSLPKLLLLWKKYVSHLLSDLFGLDPINDGIQYQWNQNADISQQDSCGYEVECGVQTAE